MLHIVIMVILVIILALCMVRRERTEMFENEGDRTDATSYICSKGTCVYWPNILNTDGTYSPKPLPEGYSRNVGPNNCGDSSTSVNNCMVTLMEAGELDPVTNRIPTVFKTVPATQVWSK